MQQYQDKMKQHRLGNTGLAVSEFALGTMMLSDKDEDWVNEQFGIKIKGKKDSYEILDKYVEMGGNFIDTANLYALGASETLIGGWIKERSQDDPHFRERFIITTKAFFGDVPNNRNTFGSSRASLRYQVEGSLRRLQLEHIDLYLIHNFEVSTPIEETARQMNEFISQGKINYWGISNWPAARIAQLVLICERNGWVKPCNAQMQYSLLMRDIETDLIDICSENGITITAWSPLAAGWLTGKFTRENKPEALSRAGGMQQFDDMVGGGLFSVPMEGRYNTIDALVAIAKKHNVEPSQVAYKWVLQRSSSNPILPIVGSGTLSHIVSGLESSKVSLSEEDMNELNKASAARPIYPNSMMGMFNTKFN